MKKDLQEFAINEDHALFILLKKRDKEAFSAIYKKISSLSLRYSFKVSQKHSDGRRRRTACVCEALGKHI